MRKLMIVSLLLSGATACNGQAEKNKQLQAKADENKPQATWKVNRKYDDKGNLVSYDSTYVWTYSSKNGKTQNVNADSVLAEFENRFGMNFRAFPGTGFNTPGLVDSSFYRDFANPDYFMKRWQQQTADMQQMMLRMDSLRNSFLKENYPGINTRSGKVNAKLKTL